MIITKELNFFLLDWDLFQLFCCWCFHPAANEEFLSLCFAQSRAGGMQLRATLSSVHYLEAAISQEQIFIVLCPFIYRQWTLSWSSTLSATNARLKSLSCRIFPFWNIADHLLLQLKKKNLKKIKKQMIDFHQVIMPGTFWYFHIFMHEWPKEKYSLFSCNLVISLSVEKADNKYWQYMRLGSTKSSPLLSWAAAVINFQT